MFIEISRITQLKFSAKKLVIQIKTCWFYTLQNIRAGVNRLDLRLKYNDNHQYISRSNNSHTSPRQRPSYSDFKVKSENSPS